MFFLFLIVFGMQLDAEGSGLNGKMGTLGVCGHDGLREEIGEVKQRL